MYIDYAETMHYLLDMFKNLWLQIILALILVDIFTGIFKALKYKKMNSSFGIQGLGKHLVFFFVAIFATYILQITKLNVFLYVIYLIYFIFYATSICENAYQLSWRIPKFVLKKLYVYQEAIDDGNIDFIFEIISRVKNGDIKAKDLENNTNLSREESVELKRLIEKAKLVKGKGETNEL